MDWVAVILNALNMLWITFSNFIHVAVTYLQHLLSKA